jgi:ribosomal-protein-serine acetyltransferase
VTSSRLVLRRWTPADAAILSSAVVESLEHLRPWMWWAAHEPLDDATRHQALESWQRDWAAGGDVIFGMFEHDQVVGACGLHRRRGPGVLEIGYWVHADHVHRGIATEAAEALTEVALGVPGIERVEIHHDRANVRSRAVPARLGFTFLGASPDGAHAPAEEGIDCTWSITAAEWRASSRHRETGEADDPQPKS